MKRKSVNQVVALESATRYIEQAARMLHEAGEPSLALRLATIGQASDHAVRLERVHAAIE